MSEILCSYSYFEVEIDDNLEGRKNVSGIKYSKK